MNKRGNRLLPLVLAGFLLPQGAGAQLMLPGAVPSAPLGTTDTPTTGGPAKPPPPPVRTPSEDTVVRKELRRNGSSGLISFDKQDRELRITRLTLPGAQISRPADVCRVDVAGGPFRLQSVDRHEGLLRYVADIPACPLTIDIMEGAVRISVPGGVCTFQQADCNAAAEGFWGPPASSFTPAEAKNIEKARTAAENTARAYFRALLANTKDRQQTRLIAADQAAFSSRREEMCRDYAREDVFGFCAARITEARAVALRSQLYPNAKDEPAPTRPQQRRPAGREGAASPPAGAPIQLR